MSDWADVGRALLGSWPALVSSWGQDAIEAYVLELGSRGLSPEEALVGLRSWEGDIPPNAGKVLELARRDLDEPIFEEMIEAVWGQGGVLSPRSAEVKRQRMRIASCSRGCDDGWIVDVEANSATPCECRGVIRATSDEERLERAAEFHPRICGFVHSQGLEHLKALGLDDPTNEHREARRVELRRAWDKFSAQQDRRDVAALVGVAPRRGAVGRPDFARVIEQTSGTGEETE